MAKTLRSFRLSAQGMADLKFCVSAGKLRMAQYGYLPPSEGEIVEQALARLARYYRSLKLPASGKGGEAKKK